MKVTVIGKSHLSGTSKKTGKPYDSTIVHVFYKKNGVDGLAAEAIWLDETYSLATVEVGWVCDVDRNSLDYLRSSFSLALHEKFRSCNFHQLTSSLAFSAALAASGV